MSARFAAFSIFLLMPLLLAGCFIPTDRDIARQLESALRKQLHPQRVTVLVHRRALLSTTIRKLDITISGFTTRAMPMMGKTADATSPGAASPQPGTGTRPSRKPALSFLRSARIIDAQIHCTDFTVRQFPIKSMDIKLHDVRVPLQGDDLTIESAEAACACVQFDEPGITRFLKYRRMPISDPTVRLTPDGCVVNAKVPSFFNTPVELSGRIRTRDEAVLYMDQPKVRVASLALPGVITDQLIKNLNPIADLNTDFDFPIPISITKTTHGEGLLAFETTLHFPRRGKTR